MLTGKWATLNPNCQRFNTIYKRLRREGKSGENEGDLMKRARQAYRDESQKKDEVIMKME